MKRAISIFWFLIILVSACQLKQDKPQVVTLGNNENYITIADTIITNVLIKNPNEDEWTDYTLRNLNKESLVNEIFKSVYEGKLKPFEFFHNEPMQIEDIKELEKNPEFSRDKIAKVQFEEAWYFDPEEQKMVKKVISIMLAYEIYNSLGEIRGYKPAFKVYFN